MGKIKTTSYCKVVGYCRAVSAWNDGKKKEFADRNTVEVKKVV